MSEIFNPGGGGAGTVTSVSGTTSQVVVTGGTGAAVVSLDPIELLAGVPYGGTTAGTATVQTVTVPNIPAALTAGTKIGFLSGFASTGATTLTVTPTGSSAYAAVNLMKRTSTAVAALGASGDMVANSYYEAIYDGTQWVLQTTSSTVYTGGALAAGGVVTGNAANQVAGTSALTFTPATGLFIKVNNEVVAGVGVVYQRGVTSQKAEAAADASVLSVTPIAQIGTYRISFVLSISAATAAVVGWTATWTDSNGTAQAPTNLALYQVGTAVPALTFAATGTSAYYGEQIIDINNSATAIVVKLTLGTGTLTTSKASAVIERLQ